jgi:methionyl-tRNA formyltransferase
VNTVLLANNRLGARVAHWLAGRGELAALVLHEPARQKHVEHLASELAVPSWTWPNGLEGVQELRPDCLLSVLFGHIVPSSWLTVPRWMPLNLHPGFLPHNAGANPNVWPIVDGSPAGTTLHVMADTIDSGQILAQRRVEVTPADTGATLYERLEDASFELLQDCWDSVESLELVPQTPGGSYHRSDELHGLDPTPSEFDLIDRLRARTFPPYGAEFERDGRRWRIRVELEPLD